MKKKIEKSITIHASPENVWRVFTDPQITKQMDGTYATNWKVGSSFGWRGTDGEMYTTGTLLEIRPKKFLKFNVQDEDEIVTSVISYHLAENDGTTELTGKEDIMDEIDDESLEEAIEGWDEALKTVKEIAEKL